MFKIQFPVFADTRKLKLIFTESAIQKLKTAFRQVVASTVILSLLGVDIAYAMQEEIYGITEGDQRRRSSYVPPKLPLQNRGDSDNRKDEDLGQGRSQYEGFDEEGEEKAGLYESFNDEGEAQAETLVRGTSIYTPPTLNLPKNKDTTEPSTPFKKGQGSPPSSDSFSSSSSDETETSPRDGKSNSGESGSPNHSRSSSPTKMDSTDSDHDEEGESASSRENSGEDIELVEMSSSKKPKDGEELSPSEIKKQMLESFKPLWNTDDLENIKWAESKKGFWGKAWDCVTSPVAGAWDYVTSPFEKAWNYVGLGFSESAEKLKDTLAKKKKGFSELGEPLLPEEEQDGLMENVHALAKVIKGTSLEDFAVYFKKQIIDKNWRWYQWLMLFPAFVLGGGTGNAMAPIIVASLFNNDYLKSASPTYYDHVTNLAYYIAVSTSLLVFTDAASFLPEAVSPRRIFSTLKTAKEWFVKNGLSSLATFQNLYLVVLLWKLEEHSKEVTDTTGYWNPFDQFFYFTAFGLFAYSVVAPYLRTRGALDHYSHRNTPSDVQDEVRAFGAFKERVKYHYSDTEIIELYDFLNTPFFPEHTSQLKEWMNYLIRGKISEPEIVGSFLKYMYLKKRAQAEMEKEPQILQKPIIERIVPKIITIDSVVQGVIGSPTGFAITAGSFYDLLNDYIGWEGALATGLTIGLTFVVSTFLQGHTFKETLEDIWEKVSPYLTGKSHFKETLKDRWALFRGFFKGLVYTFAAGQNTLTNVGAEFAFLVFIIPQYFGADENTQLGITIGMGLISSPHLFTEMVNGTRDIGGAVLKIYWNGRRIFHLVTRHYFMTARQMRLEVVSIVGDLGNITRNFSPEHVQNMKVLKKFIDGTSTKTNLMLENIPSREKERRFNKKAQGKLELF